MRAIIPELLWIGNAFDARDVQGALSLGIRAVVDLAAGESPLQYPRDISLCRLPLHDGTGNDPAVLQLAVFATAELIRSRVPTLVACSAGMSRSLAIVAAALAVVERQPPDEVLAKIAADGPHDVSGALWEEVKRLTTMKHDAAAASLELVVLRSRQPEVLQSFYANLGLVFQQERHGTGPVHFAANAAGIVFEIYPAAQENDAVDVTNTVGFRVADLNQLLQRLRNEGISPIKPPRQTPWGTRAVVADPDGRTVELYAD